jgi:hypothetical protein
MAFDLTDCQFTGPALPEPFVKFELENELTKLKLLVKITGTDGKQLKEDWDAYRRHLAQLAVRGGPLRVRNQVIEPLCKRLGYTGEIESAADVETREGREDDGYLLTADGAKLRVWTTDLDEDLDAPAKRGQAYRFSHLRIAQRVLLASGERVGLLTNGVELRLLISDPARPDSQVIFALDPNWKRSRDIPDSFRLLLALVTPKGVSAVPGLVDKARLQQARVTKDLRDQARQAIGRFVQEVLDHPDNQEWFAHQKDRAVLARALWHEGLVLVYRLLFILKLESSDDPDLGRVYEALLELEPGIAGEPMCRLRRQKLEVVVPIAQGEKYRPRGEGRGTGDEGGLAPALVPGDEPEDDEENMDEEDDVDESSTRGKKTTVQWIEEIDPHKFYLRVGLGRKATGSYYTPHSFVRFLVQETLGPQVAELSPQDDPQPDEILKLKVLDPAMGSGHFLVEACRFLGQHLYEAARLCDEKAIAAERRAETAKHKEDREAALAEAQKYRQRVIDLPDPDDELLRYLPSRATEGEQAGYSQRRAEALCRRLVAVHCLYGVDKNPLAVELAKLALWLESHAEGMPLTFLDHRFVVGDSLTGPFWDKLTTRPSSPKEPIEGVFHQGLTLSLKNKLADALSCVRHLEATVGISLAEVKEKEAMKAELDQALRPFRILAAAWSGGVMLGPKNCDDFGYAELLKSVATTGDLPTILPSPNGRGAGGEGFPADRDALYALLASGRCVPALSLDLTFPEVFYPHGVPYQRHGFDVALGNPPWDKLRVERRDLLASVDSDYLTGKESAGSGDEHILIERAFALHPEARREENSVAGTIDPQESKATSIHSESELGDQTV